MSATASATSVEEREQRLEALEEHLRSGDDDGVRARVAELHAADLARALTALEPEDRDRLLAHASAERSARALAELDPPSCARLLEDLADERVVALVGELSVEDAVDVLEHLSEDRRHGVVERLPAPLRVGVARRLRHPPESAGRIMTVDVPRIHGEGTVREARAELRARSEECPALNAIFVIDEDGRLVGKADPLALLLADPARPVRDLADREIPSVLPERDQEEVADLATRYDLLAVPVTDADGVLPSPSTTSTRCWTRRAPRTSPPSWARGSTRRPSAPRSARSARACHGSWSASGEAS